MMTKKKTLILLIIIGFLTAGFSFGKKFFSKEPFQNSPVLAQSSTDWPQLQHDSAKSGHTSHSVSAPYNIVWRWHPSSNQVSISGKVQPVVAYGLMCVGFYDGKMYCLDADTGQEKWSFQTGGPILHTAAFGNNKVFFTSQDGAVYAVDLNGNLVWKYQTDKGIQNAPCLNNNTLYIGSGDGYFYALDVNTGTEKWRYDTGYPILTSAACVDNRVYFGNEGLYAYVLNDNGSNAGLVWKKRLKGQSMAGYWPVVSSGNQVVFFRTQPLGDFHDVLNAGNNLLSQGGDEWTETNRQIEQQNITNYLEGEGAKWKTFYSLDINTGEEKYLAPVLYTSGEGTIPVPPVVDEVNNRAWVVWRTKYNVFYTMGVRAGVDLGKLNLSNGSISHFFGPEVEYVHLIGDETTILTAQQNALLTSSRGTLTGVDLNNERSFSIVNSFPSAETDYNNGNAGPFAYDNGWSKGDILGGGGQGGGLCAGAAIANNKIYWIARYGLVIAVE